MRKTLKFVSVLVTLYANVETCFIAEEDLLSVYVEKGSFFLESRGIRHHFDFSQEISFFKYLPSESSLPPK